MNFFDELSWRGMIHDSTPGVEMVLNSGMVTGYIGFDPTAPSLTIGNYVQVMLLKLFQLSGHQPIVVMGGATGRIGDPSGKDKERELKSYEELDENLAFQAKQFAKFLEFDEGPNRAILFNNLDIYKNMNVLDFLRDVGKGITVAPMIKKDSVQKRLQAGLSFTEFSYQVLQGYDFQYLYQHKNCILQMGGSDQWGNIVAGTDFIGKNTGGKAYALTTPLLTKADGTKFGKSTDGNIWLDPEMTSPYKFYQYWINTDDRDLPKFIRYFTLHSRAEVEQMEQDLADKPNELKRLLAEELTVRVHSREEFDAAQQVSELLFNRKASRASLLGLNAQSLKTVSEEIPSHHVSKELIINGIGVIDLMAEATSMVNSKGDARRAIKGGAVSINKKKITAHDATINSEQLLHGKYIMLENGKKNKVMIVAE